MVLTKQGRKLCVWLPEELYLAVKAEAATDRKNASQIVAEALEGRKRPRAIKKDSRANAQNP
jgi:hypothetical protein